MTDGSGDEVDSLSSNNDEVILDDDEQSQLDEFMLDDDEHNESAAKLSNEG